MYLLFPADKFKKNIGNIYMPLSSHSMSNNLLQEARSVLRGFPEPKKVLEIVKLHVKNASEEKRRGQFIVPF